MGVEDGNPGTLRRGQRIEDVRIVEVVIPRPVAGSLVHEIDALRRLLSSESVFLAVVGVGSRDRIDVPDRDVRQSSDRRLVEGSRRNRPGETRNSTSEYIPAKLYGSPCRHAITQALLQNLGPVRSINCDGEARRIEVALRTASVGK